MGPALRRRGRPALRAAEARGTRMPAAPPAVLADKGAPPAVALPHRASHVHRDLPARVAGGPGAAARSAPASELLFLDSEPHLVHRLVVKLTHTLLREFMGEQRLHRPQ